MTEREKQAALKRCERIVDNPDSPAYLHLADRVIADAEPPRWCYWTGPPDGEWFDPNNWKNRHLPRNGDSAVIYCGVGIGVDACVKLHTLRVLPWPVKPTYRHRLHDWLRVHWLVIRCALTRDDR